MAAIRGDQRGEGGRGYGLRRWESGYLHPRPGDVFQERLYCVRWRLPRLSELLWADKKKDAQNAPLPDWVPLVLRYLAARNNIDHWRTDAAAARLVAGAVENDHV